MDSRKRQYNGPEHAIEKRRRTCDIKGSVLRKRQLQLQEERILKRRRVSAKRLCVSPHRAGDYLCDVWLKCPLDSKPWYESKLRFDRPPQIHFTDFNHQFDSCWEEPRVIAAAAA